MSATPSPSRPGRVSVRRAARVTVPLLAVLLGTSACSVEDLPNFGFPEPVTLQGEKILRLWEGSAAASLVVGAFVWGLIFFAIIAYRKRGDTVPRQVQYNLPVEILYTAVPIVIVAVLFVFTYRAQDYVVSQSADPDVNIGVVGFRWGWEFDYIDADVQVISERTIEGSDKGDPTLVLPVGQTIRFTESSPDVIHSFWVPAFLFKRDVIPGRLNTFELTIDTPGTYRGHCAELCGQYHSQMNFYVKAVSPREYEQYLQDNKGTINGVEQSASVTTGAETATTDGGAQ